MASNIDKAARYDEAVRGLKSLIYDAKATVNSLQTQNAANTARINQLVETRSQLETFLDNLTREPRTTQELNEVRCTVCGGARSTYRGCDNEGCPHNGTSNA